MTSSAKISSSGLLFIAAVGDNAHRAYLDKGGSGFGVRLLTELALSF